MRWLERARPEQLGDPEATTILLEGGRGAGKTRSGAEWASWHCHQIGAGARVALVGRTFADAKGTMVEGPGSGLLEVLPRSAISKWNRNEGELVLENGAKLKCFGATEPDRLRGPQFSAAWCDELASWERPETWDTLQMALRIGEHPQNFVTTTPRPTPFYRRVRESKGTTLRRMRTVENLANLSPTFEAEVMRQYAGTRLGRQELDAELLEDIEGALWTLTVIDNHRMPAYGSVEEAARELDLVRCVVGVDPAGGGGDEIGIVCVGKGSDGHAYVLADRSGRFSPEDWARRTVGLYEEANADAIVVERNFGGDMVTATLRAVDKGVAIREVVASRGKRVRAEPVSAYYSRGIIHHVGSFPKLEDEMTQWTPESGYSPDRVDALVWAVTELLKGTQGSAFLEVWKAELERAKTEAPPVPAELRNLPRLSAEGAAALRPGCKHRWMDGLCVYCGGRKES